MDFEELRASIPATRSMTYLNTGWAGPSPARVLERMRETAARESDVGPAGPDGLAYIRGIQAEARASAAKMINADVEEIVLTHGTTEGVNIVLHGIAWEPGDKMLTTDLEHPALKAPSAILGDRRGLTVRPVAISPQASADECIEAVRAAITPNTKIVALSHIMFTCGLRVPATEITALAHEMGTMVLLDGAQTGGQIALDMREIGADFYTISGQKWLMGPTGSGALYVRRDRQGLLTPLFRDAGAESRSGLAMHALASQGAVARAGFDEAIAINLELGRERVEARTADLAARMRDGLGKIAGVTINGPTNAAIASAITAVAAEGWEPGPLADALWERHRIAARTVTFPPGVRFCTGPFNDEGDVDRTVEALSSLAREA